MSTGYGIKSSKTEAGNLFTVLFGLAEIIDGLVRISSLGFCYSSLRRYVVIRQLRIEKVKKQMSEGGDL